MVYSGVKHYILSEMLHEKLKIYSKFNIDFHPETSYLQFLMLLKVEAK